MFAHVFIGFLKHLSNFNTNAVDKSDRITVLKLILRNFGLHKTLVQTGQLEFCFFRNRKMKVVSSLT
jgi:hypothetical protein